LDQAQLAEVESEVDYKQDNLVHSAMVALQVATNLMPQLVERWIERKQLQHAVLAKERAEADMARQQAELDLQRGTMRSPVDGVVLARPIRNERRLAAGTVLLRIGRLDDLQVEAEILSQEVVRVRPGASVEIFGPAIGRPPARGRITRVDPAGFTKISSLGVEQQRVRVIADFVEEDLVRLRQQRHLGVGYRVRLRIITGQAPRALRIPRSALFRAPNGQWQVFSVTGSTARLRTVQVGLINDDLAEVVAGLAQGDLVVIAPPTDLVDRTRVQWRTVTLQTVEHQPREHQPSE
jgi:HlyD family secretion protein